MRERFTQVTSMSMRSSERLAKYKWRLALAALLCAVLPALAQQKPAETPPGQPEPIVGPKITIKLVTDFESQKLVSELEDFQPVTTTVFGQGGSSEVTLGEKSVLWVRNAHVDGKFFFERRLQAHSRPRIAGGPFLAAGETAVERRRWR